MLPEKIYYVEQNKELVTSLFNSPVFNSLLDSILTPYNNLQDDLIWLAQNLLDIDKAQGWHLDFIGMHPRVQQPRTLFNFNPNPYFGFKGLNGTEAYMSETFSSISNPSVGGYWNSYTHLDVAGSRRLNDEEYRRVIKARIVFNNATGSINDILRVVNLITNNTISVLSVVENRKLRLKYSDPTGLLDYFISRLDRADNIIPLTYGVNLEVVEFHSDELDPSTPETPQKPNDGGNPENPSQKPVGAFFGFNSLIWDETIYKNSVNLKEQTNFPRIEYEGYKLKVSVDNTSLGVGGAVAEIPKPFVQEGFTLKLISEYGENEFQVDEDFINSLIGEYFVGSGDSYFYLAPIEAYLYDGEILGNFDTHQIITKSGDVHSVEYIVEG